MAEHPTLGRTRVGKTQSLLQRTKDTSSVDACHSEVVNQAHTAIPEGVTRVGVPDLETKKDNLQVTFTFVRESSCS